MAYELFADGGFVRELAKLPSPSQEAVRGALEGLRDHPDEHPKVARLHGTRYPRSFRMRVGSLRLLGMILPSQNLVFMTTIFLKKRDTDYRAALLRHDMRLAAQGPPLADAIQAARKKRA